MRQRALATSPEMLDCPSAAACRSSSELSAQAPAHNHVHAHAPASAPSCSSSRVLSPSLSLPSLAFSFFGLLPCCCLSVCVCACACAHARGQSSERSIVARVSEQRGHGLLAAALLVPRVYLCLLPPTQLHEERAGDVLPLGQGQRLGQGTGQTEQHREAVMDSRRLDAEKMHAHAHAEKVLGLMKIGVPHQLLLQPPPLSPRALVHAPTPLASLCAHAPASSCYVVTLECAVCISQSKA